MKLLENIESPKDLKKLNKKKLETLCKEIREEIIKVVSKRGGHLAPSLGAVELTVGLHLALDCPYDKIVWDVGHQCYAHKLLTGRVKDFYTLRSYGGVSGFPRREESEYDTVNTGHASTAISAALGLAKARDIKEKNNTIVAVVGDGSLSGGLSYEGLNQAGHLGADIIVVLNDNKMSIDKNVGALSSYLNRIINDISIKKMRDDLKSRIAKIPGLGRFIVNIGENIEDTVRNLVIPGRLFEEMGFKYIGPIDGHDIEEVVKQVRFAKETGGPVFIHTRTIKGKGYKPAEENPDQFHGTPPFELSEGGAKTKSNPQKRTSLTYTQVFGQALVELAKEKEDIVAITAAMSNGTGLDLFAKEYPKRFFDVGIAEEHAVTFAAGLAISGLRPVVAIYSTFLQRGYDQLIHDVALSGLHVVFALDRAGLVGEDGPTHHGLFDLSYLKSIPGMTVMAPSNEQELRNMLYTAVSLTGPVAIRFPRGEGPGFPLRKFRRIEVGKARILKKGEDVLILAVGRMVVNAEKASILLGKEGISVTIVDVRFVKPYDKELFLSIIPLHKLVVTLEENYMGGFGDSIARFISENDIETPPLFCHVPDNFITHGAVEDLMKEAELDAESVAKKILAKIKKTSSIVQFDASRL